MVFNLLMFGSIWFYIFASLIFVGLLVEVIYEKFSAAVVTLLFFLLMIWLFGDLRISMIREHYMSLLQLGGIYLVGGVITSFLKWAFFVRDSKDKYDTAKDEFLDRKGHKGAKTVPEELREEWNNEVNRSLLERRIYDRAVTINDLIPSAREHKGRIIGWMGWWPLVVFWSLFDDIIRRGWEIVYRFVQEFYQLIGSMIYRNVSDELKFTPKPVEPPASHTPSSTRRGGSGGY